MSSIQAYALLNLAVSAVDRPSAVDLGNMLL
jgi:hypothetical protein